MQVVLIRRCIWKEKNINVVLKIEMIKSFWDNFFYKWFSYWDGGGIFVNYIHTGNINKRTVMAFWDR